MALPVQVAQAEKDAEALFKKSQESDNPPPDPDKPAPTGDEVPQEVLDLQKALAAAEQKHGIKSLAQRFQVIQGKYNTEVKNADVNEVNRLKSKLREKDTQINQLIAAQDETRQLLTDVQTELAKMKEKPSEPAGQEKPKVIDPSSVLDPEELAHLEKEDLSGRTLQIFTKLATLISNLSNKADPNLVNQVEKLSNEVKETNKKIEDNKNQTWEERIKGAIPDFEIFVAPVTPEVAAWMSSPISPLSKRTNGMEMQEAYATRDLETLSAYAQSYRDSITPPKKKDEPLNPLEQHIEPSEDNNAIETPKAGDDQTLYKQAEVNKFYLDQTKGKYRGREEEAKRLNKIYLQAATEGRVIP